MLSFGVIDLYLLSLAFDLVRSVSGGRLVSGARMAVPDWLSDVVPEWLAEVMRPKKAPVPWAAMSRAVLALWVPLAVGFATGRRELALLPAMGGLLSVTIDNGGPYWARVEQIGTAAVLGGAPGLLIGTLIHGHGWIAVLAVVVIAGVSAILARLGALGSVTGLQLFIYSALGLGPLGLLRPWWHTALGFLVGVAWALLLITPGYLLSPRSAERKAVAGVYYALAQSLRLIGTPGVAGARVALAGALNAAYNAMLTGRASAPGLVPTLRERRVGRGLVRVDHRRGQHPRVDLPQRRVLELLGNDLRGHLAATLDHAEHGGLLGRAAGLPSLLRPEAGSTPAAEPHDLARLAANVGLVHLDRARKRGRRPAPSTRDGSSGKDAPRATCR